jgi:hypothetical protein
MDFTGVITIKSNIIHLSLLLDKKSFLLKYLLLYHGNITTAYHDNMAHVNVKLIFSNKSTPALGTMTLVTSFSLHFQYRHSEWKVTQVTKEFLAMIPSGR